MMSWLSRSVPGITLAAHAVNWPEDQLKYVTPRPVPK